MRIFILIFAWLLAPVAGAWACERTISPGDRVKDVQEKLDCLHSENEKLRQEINSRPRESGSDIRGEDLAFYHLETWSRKLWERQQQKQEPAWEALCAGAAARAITRTGARLVYTTDYSSRGQLGSMHFAIQCNSYFYGEVYVHGFSKSDEINQLKATMREALNNLREIMPEFR